MKPEVDQILSISAGQLLATAVPLLPNNYAQGSTSVLAFMMFFCAQEYERGAEIRACENSEMRELFGELSANVTDRELKEKITTAALSADSSLLISALDKSNADLRKLLIALQVHFEERGDAEARACEKRIWKVLKASAERRFLKPPGA